MEIIRIGSKLISREKINEMIDQILQLRVQGYSQQEVGSKLNVDRTFVSRLETLGEVRKGSSIAVLGFPIKNKQELQKNLVGLGIEYMVLMTEEERWQFVRGMDGLELFNRVLDIITQLRSHDVVLVIASNYRIRMCRGLLDNEVVGYEIGKSPIEEDKQVPVDEIVQIVRTIMEERDGREALEDEANC